MHNQQKLTHTEQENGLKPHFGPFLALLKPYDLNLKLNSHFGIRVQHLADHLKSQSIYQNTNTTRPFQIMGTLI